MKAFGSRISPLSEVLSGSDSQVSEPQGGGMSDISRTRAGFPDGPTRTIIVEPLEQPDQTPAPAEPKRIPERPARPRPEPKPEKRPAKVPAGA